MHKISIDAGLTCPNRDGTVGSGGCIYCNTRGSGTGAFAHSSIIEQIQSAKAFLARRYRAKKFIAYFQSFSNTYAPVEKLRRLYIEALADKDIIGLAIGTRPDCVDDAVLDLLARINEQTYVSIEYGLQSIHERTLKLINRGHTVETFQNAVSLTRKKGLDITVHVIIGLPGEDKKDILMTARALG
ncbi:MAG TPA: TIGR01212 family radical SAM protein, partial [Anaerolineae bacterium]|nr:TIGR01212 family radical SAM protein [Anaerolineae bacterium]